MVKKWFWGLGLMIGLTCSLTGCGRFRETHPARTATEQALISSSADRAITSMPLEFAEGRNVHIDASLLDAYDKPYVVARFRKALLDAGARIVTEAGASDMTLEISSGALSTTQREFLIGIPEIPIPVPAAETFVLPELALFKVVYNRGRAKLLVNAIDTETGAQTAHVDTALGRSFNHKIWVFFTGPHGWGNIWDEPEAETEEE